MLAERLVPKVFYSVYDDGRLGGAHDGQIIAVEKDSELTPKALLKKLVDEQWQEVNDQKLLILRSVFDEQDMLDAYETSTVFLTHFQRKEQMRKDKQRSEARRRFRGDTFSGLAYLLLLADYHSEGVVVDPQTDEERPELFSTVLSEDRTRRFYTKLFEDPKSRHSSRRARYTHLAGYSFAGLSMPDNLIVNIGEHGPEISTIGEGTTNVTAIKIIPQCYSYENQVFQLRQERPLTASTFVNMPDFAISIPRSASYESAVDTVMREFPGRVDLREIIDLNLFDNFVDNQYYRR